jgi:hypothetical protein
MSIARVRERWILAITEHSATLSGTGAGDNRFKAPIFPGLGTEEAVREG